MKKKTLVLLLALVLVVGCAVGGTLAWLTDTTAEVKNTFTTSDVNIELTENKGGDSKEFKMVPGCTIEKDPTVTVKANSEKCWLFVKVEESTNFDTFMEYTMADSWIKGNGTDIPDNVYYRTVDAATADQPFEIIKGNTVTVKGDVTKAQMNALNAEGAALPTLTFTAYACQWAKGDTSFTPAEAWEQFTTT